MSWLPIPRSRFLERQKLYQDIPQMTMTEEEVIRRNVDWLIGRCYEANEETGAHVSDEQLERLGLLRLRREAINWGDLSCSDVKPYADGSWEITIEEAAPSASALYGYIRDWMTKWGWRVNVRTEW